VKGLTYKIFWDNIDEILDSEYNICETIVDIVERSKTIDLLPQVEVDMNSFVKIGNTNVYMGDHASGFL